MSDTTCHISSSLAGFVAGPAQSLDNGGTTFHFVTGGFDAAYSAACASAGESGVDIVGGRGPSGRRC